MTDDLVTGAGELPRLEQRLILSRWFCRLFGFSDFNALREEVRRQKEGVTEDSRTYISQTLEGLSGLNGVAADEIVAWDARILGYVARLNSNRPSPVELKYFQYLAVLFSEIYLDRYANGRAELLAGLNSYVAELNGKLVGNTPAIRPFTDVQLRKLAFWLATGSGKTLLMHVHLWQYEYYCGLPTDGSLVLITPDEALSRQHLREFGRSGIPARPYHVEADLLHGPASVLVIEITKLTETKTGGGQRVEVAAFGNKNVVFVDEGHRGASGDVWRTLRSALGADGFTFEYSATLGQVVNGAAKGKRLAMLEEYGHCILVDYAYPHFHDDGYGKDYWVTNVAEDTGDNSDLVLLGNLLSFFQQITAYQRAGSDAKAQNIEAPLWIFVGHTVTGSTRTDKQSISDVETVVEFLSRFLADRDAWLTAIDQVLNEDTALKDDRQRDLFHGHFGLLRATAPTAGQLYDDIVATVFHASTGQELQSVELRAAPGEMGLRAGGDRPFFAVINIGDVKGLQSKLAARGIPTHADQLTRSLFAEINQPSSKVQMLIGSRKFMEGWDSFRVSSMALMNIGRNEGSQIVQLFGRGVRLWGKDFSLKRTAADPGNTPSPETRHLETLNVFGIRANYMADFRAHLEAEGVAVDVEDFELPIKLSRSIEPLGLKTLRLSGATQFKREKIVRFTASDVPAIALDLRPRLERAAGGSGDSRQKVAGENAADRLRALSSVLDLDRLTLDLAAFVRAKKFDNLVFDRSDVAAFLLHGKYELQVAAGLLTAASHATYERAHDLAGKVLAKAAAALYDRTRRAWEGTHLKIDDLAADDPNLTFGKYVLRVATGDPTLVANLKRVVRLSQVYHADQVGIPSLVLAEHLYQPLLLDDPTGLVPSARPPALNRGEGDFVRRLRDHIATNPPELQQRNLYLLRNLTRGRGIALFEPDLGEAFYPDFVLWLVDGNEQRIAFIDPKGLIHARGGFNDAKIALHKRLAALTSTITQSDSSNVVLTSFIVSTTTYSDLAPVFGNGRHTKEEFETEHVLFGEDPAVGSKVTERLSGLAGPE